MMKPEDFAMQKERAYPMHTEAHAKDSLARVEQNGTPEEKQKVRAAVYKRHPKLAAKKPDTVPYNEAPAKNAANLDRTAKKDGIA